MAKVAGVALYEGRPISGATAKLWASGRFVGSPAKDTALPSGSPTASLTTGTTYGSDGAYRFDGVSDGDWYVSIEWNGSILYDCHTRSSTSAQFANVKTYGAVGDGVTNDTTAIQAALDDTTYGFVYFPPGTYLSGNLVLSRGNVILEGQDAEIDWTGTGTTTDFIGLKILGTLTSVQIRHLTFRGDGTASHYHAGIWWKNGSGAYNLKVDHCHFLTLVRGISGVRSASGVWQGIHITNCRFDTTGGTGTSQGEAIYLEPSGATTADIQIEGNTFYQSDKHDVRLVTATGARVSGNTHYIHRAVTATGTYSNGMGTPAIKVEGGRQIKIEGNTFYSPADGAIGVASTTALASRSIQIEGNVIEEAANSVEEIIVGTTNPATVGTVDLVTVANNEIYRTGIQVAPLRINCGTRVRIDGNNLQLWGLTAAVGAVHLLGSGEGAGTANYSDNIHVADNLFYGTDGGAGSFYGISMAAAFCQGGATASFLGNETKRAGALAGADFFCSAAITGTGFTFSSQGMGGLSFTGSGQPGTKNMGPVSILNTLATGTALAVGTGRVGLGTTSPLTHLHLVGGLSIAPTFLTSASSPYTVLSTDTIILCNTAAGSITVNLPAAAQSTSRVLFIAKTNTANSVTIDPNGAEQIDGAGTVGCGGGPGTLGTNGIVTNGTAWTSFIDLG